MPRPTIDLEGHTFGRLTVVSRIGTDDKTRAAVWRCACSCGGEVNVRSDVLRAGKSQSCGCLAKGLLSARAKKHGMSRTPTWNSWHSMVRRCTDESYPAYQTYGKVGVEVCDRWVGSFENFLDDMGERPDGMTIDRRDNAKGYFPENCRWATAEQQSRNRGDYNVTFVHAGSAVSAKELAKIKGVSLATAYRIIKKGI